MSTTRPDAPRAGRKAGAAKDADGAAPLVVRVRHCETPEDYGWCVRLQVATWGEGYRDLVAGSLLKVSRRVGGVVAGAFLDSGEMAGFVFGLTGTDGRGRLVHWSHMLAVAPEYRDRGVGRRLKAFQLEALAGLGVESAYWTFDPLVARNAHLNLNRLAVRFEEYVPDMYADTGSELHTFGTDRFVVSIPIGNGSRRSEPGEAASGPVVNLDASGAPSVVPLEVAEPAVRIQIPLDIGPLLPGDVGALRHWRASTRAAFQCYLARGYRPAGFRKGADAGWYVLRSGGEPA